MVAFEAPFGGLGATYDVHLRLIGKLVGDFLLVIIELFSLCAFVLSQYTSLTDGQTDRQTESRQQYRAYASQSHGKNRYPLHWTANIQNSTNTARSHGNGATAR